MDGKPDNSGPRGVNSEAADQAGPITQKEADQDEAAVDLADELLIDGQEEVFSRTEVESGRFEHHFGEERAARRKS